jgi:hypothetical protein
MEFLGEDEFGFTTDRIGFPSVSGCRAILYQNAVGLFGFHNRGGSGSSQWAGRAAEFVTYVTNHPSGTSEGRALFVVTFASGGGYANKSEWKGEAKEFAKALQFKGKRKGFDLAKTFKGSAYVEYRRVGHDCLLFGNEWIDTSNPKPVAAIANPQDHQFRPSVRPRPVYTSVDMTGLVALTPISLM